MVFVVYAETAEGALRRVPEVSSLRTDIDTEEDGWAGRLSVERNKSLFDAAPRTIFLKRFSVDRIPELRAHPWLKKRDIIIWFSQKPKKSDIDALKPLFARGAIKVISEEEDGVAAQTAIAIGLTIRPTTLRQLVEIYGEGEQLKQELVKIKAYFGGRDVDPKELGALLQRPTVKDDKLEGLSGAIVERNPVLAYQELRKERLLGTEPIKIMGFINGAFSYRRPRFTGSETAKILARLADLDTKVKKGLTDREGFFDDVFSAVFG